ncbi:MAG: flagellar biosynthetic protein FliO [Candidatus Sericytochromatia bacterium]|nr:flagellar biosynthetic protein FliO [Candidatus Sericytochromatia bacterium]
MIRWLGAVLIGTGLLLCLPGVASARTEGAEGWKIMAPVDLEAAAEEGLRGAFSGREGQAPAAVPPPPREAPPREAPSVTPPRNTSPAYLQEDQPFKLRDYEEPKLQAESPWWQQTGGMLVKLVLVVMLLVGVLWFVKRGSSGGRINFGFTAPKGRNLVVLESTHLGPQQTMHLVSVGGDRLIVVGASPSGLTTLATVDEPTQVQLLLAASRGQSTGFNQVYDLESLVQEPGGEMFRGALSDLNRRGGWD